eukprot:Rhum_TRINITY_DN5850_c0_g1::Rhum_TRINITY_DN5850_c0_g1_i1::g.18396::m.18396
MEDGRARASEELHPPASVQPVAGERNHPLQRVVVDVLLQLVQGYKGLDAPAPPLELLRPVPRRLHVPAVPREDRHPEVRPLLVPHGVEVHRKRTLRRQERQLQLPVVAVHEEGVREDVAGLVLREVLVEVRDHPDVPRLQRLQAGLVRVEAVVALQQPLSVDGQRAQRVCETLRVRGTVLEVHVLDGVGDGACVDVQLDRGHVRRHVRRLVELGDGVQVVVQVGGPVEKLGLSAGARVAAQLESLAKLHLLRLQHGKLLLQRVDVGCQRRPHRTLLRVDRLQHGVVLRVQLPLHVFDGHLEVPHRVTCQRVVVPLHLLQVAQVLLPLLDRPLQHSLAPHQQVAFAGRHLGRVLRVVALVRAEETEGADGLLAREAPQLEHLAGVVPARVVHLRRDDAAGLFEPAGDEVPWDCLVGVVDDIFLHLLQVWVRRRPRHDAVVAHVLHHLQRRTPVLLVVQRCEAADRYLAQQKPHGLRRVRHPDVAAEDDTDAVRPRPRRQPEAVLEDLIHRLALGVELEGGAGVRVEELRLAGLELLLKVVVLHAEDLLHGKHHAVLGRRQLLHLLADGVVLQRVLVLRDGHGLHPARCHPQLGLARLQRHERAQLHVLACGVIPVRDRHDGEADAALDLQDKLGRVRRLHL